MRQLLTIPALAICAAAGLSPALAADEDLPPEFRTSTFEIYAGVFGAADTIRSEVKDDAGLVLSELDGTAFGYGFRGGVDYVMDGWVIGAVGDWSFGDDIASDTLAITEVSLLNLATLRARAGITLGNTLVYLTGGVAGVEGEFRVEDTAPLNGTRKQWSTSWTLGGGIDIGITDSLALGVEYLYVDVDDPSYTFGTGPTPPPEIIEYEVDGIHTVRVGMNYAFQI